MEGEKVSWERPEERDDWRFGVSWRASHACKMEKGLEWKQKFKQGRRKEVDGGMNSALIIAAGGWLRSLKEAGW